MLIATSVDLLQQRADLLIPVLAAAFFIGEFLARYSGLEALLKTGAGYLDTTQRKLDRSQRGVATRLYRGIIVLALVMLATFAVSKALARPLDWLQLLSVLTMIALFGYLFHTIRDLRLYRQAARAQLKLELPTLDYLFADTHGVLRYLTLTGAQDFACIVGASVWYLLGGLPLMFLYLVLAATHARFTSPIFGWAAHAFFHVVHALPRLLTIVFLTLAAFFVPHAKPFAVFRARQFHGAVAQLLHLSLGGPLPERELPWAGDGTPKLEPIHFLRFQLLRLVTTILLLLALATPHLVKLLNNINT